ncbi:hypothetical protein GTW98_13130 [Streptomyces sp. SID8375]|uniref:hypothetical protein n=1 Tax=unclassified Streptomyces TaxID=2593676 RepID=UPI0003808D3E|nr:MULTISPECIES: hypothetical protein [unclassified Streptomyces]MYX07736.1 hypothetical protein [Streptomyces sp. SID8375]
MSTTKTEQATAVHDLAALRVGDAAAADLKAALARVDLVLPSLRGSWPVNGGGFVELGGCSAKLAAQLADIINAGADVRQATEQ